MCEKGNLIKFGTELLCSFATTCAMLTMRSLPAMSFDLQANGSKRVAAANNGQTLNHCKATFNTRVC